MYSKQTKQKQKFLSNAINKYEHVIKLYQEKKHLFDGESDLSLQAKIDIYFAIGKAQKAREKAILLYPKANIPKIPEYITIKDIFAQ